MKKIYWRPRTVSRPALILNTVIALAGLALVERCQVVATQPYLDEKTAAAKLAQDAFAAVKARRIELGPPIDRLVDPSESGLIGIAMSPVTSVLGDVAAKQTSANPNFAAVLVDMLKEVGVRENDVVAIGMSGSFPALNICTYAACETLKVKPLVISSASASQWGANLPTFMWPQMERLLRNWGKKIPIVENGKPVLDANGEPTFEEDGVFTIKSIACSIGGNQDRGEGLSEEGIALVKAAIQKIRLRPFRADVAKISPEGDVVGSINDDFTDNVDERMHLYKEEAEGKPIKVYINVGGGVASVGRDVGKQMFLPGVNTRPPQHVREIDGVMPRFIKMGIPVIHIVHINALATRYELPLEPAKAPTIGEGGVFKTTDYSRPLVVGVLAVILASLYGFIRSDVGFRLLQASQRSRQENATPEPMV